MAMYNGALMGPSGRGQTCAAIANRARSGESFGLGRAIITMYTRRGCLFARTSACLLLTIGLATRAEALDPRRATTQYVIKTWQRDNGLPYSAVTALAQTDSYLWLGTNAGLTRFDGAVFTKAGEGPLEVGVAALAPAEDGTVWIATQSGQVGQLKEGWLTLSEGPDRNYAITSLLPTRSGAL